MAWVRKLPSGKWAATVRLPTGKKITDTYLLKGAAEKWARDQEAALERGDWIDPRLSKITVGEWWERCLGSRSLELASRKRDASHWKVHVAPVWEDIPLSAILQPDVSKWVVAMEDAGVGPDTVIGSLKVLRGLLEQAVAAKRLQFNAASNVKTKKPAPSPDRIFSPDEERIFLDALRDRFGDRPDAALFAETLIETGLRWEELAGLHRPNVDMRHRRIHVIDVMERDRTIRHYPKSEAGIRDVPVGDALWPRLRDHVLTRPVGALVFVTREGKPLDYSRWRSRVWLAVMSVPTELGGNNGQKVLASRPLLDEPLPTPHDCRHTFGTRLAEQHVPLHEIMALLGQKDPRAAQRYIHAQEARFQRAREAMVAARAVGAKSGGS